MVEGKPLQDYKSKQLVLFHEMVQFKKGFFIYWVQSIVKQILLNRNSSGASRMRARQGICVLRQGILGHFGPLLDIFGAKDLFKDTFLFESRGCIPLPPRCAPE